MKYMIQFPVIFIVAVLFSSQAYCLELPEIEFQVFQFPRNQMPRIDGDTSDWDMVGESYTYRTDQLDGTRGGHGAVIDTTDINVSVRVGWVEGLDRLYFLYEAYDDYWDFSLFN